MGKTKLNGWENIKVRTTTLREVKEYSKFSLAPVAALVDEAIEFWKRHRLPDLMKPFERQD